MIITMPPPTCEEKVIEKIRERRKLGLKKYGTSVERTDLSEMQWLQHAQDEAMDCAIYLQKLMCIKQESIEARTSHP